MDALVMHRYPVRKALEGRETGLGAHLDLGFTTILLTDGTEGLQVCRDKGKPEGEREWVAVSPQAPGTFVLNFGRLLETITKGKCQAVLHRVVNVAEKERKSVAFFADPSADARVGRAGLNYAQYFAATSTTFKKLAK